MVAKTAEELNDLSNRIIGIAIDIHKKLGPGFQGKIYPVRKPQHLCRGWWKWKVSAGYWGRSQSPPLSNGVYEEALLTEFKKSGIGYEKQKVIRVDYDGQGLGNQRIDLPVVLHKNITIFHKIFRRFYAENHIPNITLNLCNTNCRWWNHSGNKSMHQNHSNLQRSSYLLLKDRQQETRPNLEFW